MKTRSIVITLVSFAAVVACGGGTIAVGDMGSNGEALQKTKDGAPTGNGTTCSWAGTSLYDEYGAGAATPTYTVGQDFASLDGCNTCDCGAQGIMCTVKECVPSDAGQACPAIARICANGQTATAGPNCSLLCPEDDGGTASDGGSFACPAIAKVCPDGTSVGPTGPNCDLICPTDSCTTLSTSASNDVAAVINANQACTVDGDCVIVENDSDCFGHCTTAMAKAGQSAFNDEVDTVNANQCTQFKAQGCVTAFPPCVAPGTAHCTNKVCTQTYP